MKKMKYIRMDTVFFCMGLIVLLPSVLIGFWFAASGYQQIGDLFVCRFMEICKFPCPGCGGTRAVYYLFSGDFRKSFLYHPCVIIGLLEYLCFMMTYVFRNYLSKKTLVKEVRISYYMYIFIGVILLQWILKLIYYFN